MKTIERFVPLGVSSLSSDAPGWNTANSTQTKQESINKPANDICNSSGPICWKCKGSGQVLDKSRFKKNKLKQKSTSQLEIKQNGGIIMNGNDNYNLKPCHQRQQQEQRMKKRKLEPVESKTNHDDTLSNKIPQQKKCSVCNGNGILQLKQKEVQSLQKPGMITKKRRHPQTSKNWKPFGPVAYGVLQMIQYIKDCQERHRNNKNNEVNNDGAGEDLGRCHPLELLYEANKDLDEDNKESKIEKKTNHLESDKQGVYIIQQGLSSDYKNTIQTSFPWFPIHPGEQVCTKQKGHTLLIRLQYSLSGFSANFEKDFLKLKSSHSLCSSQTFSCVI